MKVRHAPSGATDRVFLDRKQGRCRQAPVKSGLRYATNAQGMTWRVLMGIEPRCRKSVLTASLAPL
jgi:hypothetical protein